MEKAQYIDGPAITDASHSNLLVRVHRAIRTARTFAGLSISLTATFLRLGVSHETGTLKGPLVPEAFLAA